MTITDWPKDNFCNKPNIAEELKNEASGPGKPREAAGENGRERETPEAAQRFCTQKLKAKTCNGRQRETT